MDPLGIIGRWTSTLEIKSMLSRRRYCFADKLRCLTSSSKGCKARSFCKRQRSTTKERLICDCKAKLDCPKCSSREDLILRSKPSVISQASSKRGLSVCWRCSPNTANLSNLWRCSRLSIRDASGSMCGGTSLSTRTTTTTYARCREVSRAKRSDTLLSLSIWEEATRILKTVEAMLLHQLIRGATLNHQWAREGTVLVAYWKESTWSRVCLET